MTAATSTPKSTTSPLLHFWSLAVEEQFYLCGRSLIWTLARFARRLRHELTIVIVGLWVLSAAACVWLTDTNPPWAFYSLPSRGVGAADRRPAGDLHRHACATCPGASSCRWRSPGCSSWSSRPSCTTPARPSRGTPPPSPVFGTALVIAGRQQRPRAVRRARRPRRQVDDVDRAALLRHLPVALAGAGAGRRDVGPAVGGPAVGRGRRVGGRRRRVVPPRRGPGPPLTVDGVPAQSQPHRRVLVAARHRARRWAAARQPPRAERRWRGGDADPARRRTRVRRRRPPNRHRPRRHRPPPPSTAVAPTAAASSAATAAATTTTIAAPPTTPAPAGPQLADLIALQQGNLEQGLTTQEVPSNLHPSLSTVRGDLPGHLRPRVRARSGPGPSPGLRLRQP